MQVAILWRSVAALLAVLYMALLGVYIANRPSYDWDMIAYIAVTLEMTGTPSDQLHDKAYSIVKDRIPPAAYDSLTGKVTPESIAATSKTTVLADSEFRQSVASDSGKFAQQLPFFSVKPVYPALMAIPYLLGTNPIEGGLIVSALAFFGIGMVFYCWFRPWMPPLIALGVMALLVINPFLVTQARTIGPDILSVFCLLFGVYSMMQNRPVSGSFALLAAIPVRPENILYLVVFELYLLGTRQLRWVHALLFIVAGLGIYEIITTVAGHYGWQTLFYYSFINKTEAIGDAHPHLTLMDYGMFYLGRLDHILIGQGEAPMFALIAFGALVLTYGFGMLRDRYVHLILLAAFIAVVRMIILPTEAFRALLPCYMLVTVAFIHACARCKQLAFGPP